jgi:hypothetical protein
VHSEYVQPQEVAERLWLKWRLPAVLLGPVVVLVVYGPSLKMLPAAYVSGLAAFIPAAIVAEFRVRSPRSDESSANNAKRKLNCQSQRDQSKPAARSFSFVCEFKLRLVWR